MRRFWIVLALMAAPSPALAADPAPATSGTWQGQWQGRWMPETAAPTIRTETVTSAMPPVSATMETGAPQGVPQVTRQTYTASPGTTTTVVVQTAPIVTVTTTTTTETFYEERAVTRKRAVRRVAPRRCCLCETSCS